MDPWINFPWSEAFLFCTVLITVLSGVVLLLSKAPSGRWLGVLLLSYVLGVSLKATFAHDYIFPSLVAIAAAFYLYCHAFFFQRTRISALHFLMVLVAFSGSYFFHSIGSLAVSLNLLILTGYLILTFRLLLGEAYARGFSYFSNPGARIAWLRNFVLLNLLGLIVLALADSVWMLGGIVLMLVGFVLYQLIRESEFLSPIPLGNKYKKSTLSPEIKATILDRIEEVLVKQEFYKRDDASLTRLAEELGVTIHHLSQVLNESLMISFQDLIARYRVREACRLLRDEKHAQVKIENVANLVGYNSKSAFNTAFKKRTGITPSEYREAKDVRSYGEERLSERKEPFNGGSAFSLNHVFNFKIRRDMIQHFFKVFFRNVRRNSLFSFLNVFGLTVGFTCSILIYLFLQDELSFDKELPDAERIYRIAWMNENPQTRTPHPMAQAMVAELPEVEQAVSFSPWYGPLMSKGKIKVENVKRSIVFEEPDFYFADSTFFDVFQLEFVEGDSNAMRKPFAFVITEPLAKKYFGDSSAIGQELKINQMPIAVSAVVKPMPKNSHFHFSAFIPYVTLKQINPTDEWMKWNDFGHFNYVKLAKGTDAEIVEQKITEWVAPYLDWSSEYKEKLLAGEVKFKLQPITDIHLTSHLRWELENNGNILYIYILSGILVFLLVIAGINYANLTSAKAVERAKEVGVRKTLGDTSGNLTVQFFFESFVFCLFALLLSILLAYFFLQPFNEFTGKMFEVTSFFHVDFLLWMVGLSFLVSVIAGFYPAIVLSNFRPTEVLKGKLTSSSRGVQLRSVLVVLQFTISAILICGSFIVFKQIQYMKTASLGFDQEALISLNVPMSIEIGGVDIPALRTAQAEFQKVSGVKGSILASNVPGEQFNQHRYYLKDQPENWADMSDLVVDYDFEKVLGVEVVQGRSFSKNYAEDSLRTVMINEAAVKRFGLENPLGKTIMEDFGDSRSEYKIIGVVKDFHYRSLHEEIQPLLLNVTPAAAGHILVKLEGKDFSTTISKVEEIYTRLVDSDVPFEYFFLDEELASLYDQEENTLSLFALFAMIALVLASLGLLGMAIAILNQRIKEVGMRKILGATSGQIMWMIMGQFLKLVGAALVLGLPVAYLLMQQWLQEFSYQAPFGLMPFVLAIVVLTVVALLSVISAVSKITYSNPVEALRYE